MPDRLLYFICFHVRSGSQWLCSMINCTGEAGRAEEVYYRIKTDIPSGWREMDGKDIGVKLSCQQMKEIWPHVGPERDSARFVFLYRRDVWAAAVSAYIAEQSKVWVNPRDDFRSPGRCYDVHDMPFSEESIVGKYNHIRNEQVEWNDWFIANSITYMRTCYEDLQDDPVGTTRRVLDYIGRPYSGNIDTTCTNVQRTNKTSAWANTLREKYGNPESLPVVTTK